MSTRRVVARAAVLVAAAALLAPAPGVAEGALGSVVGDLTRNGGSALPRLLGWLHQTDTTAIEGGKLAQQRGSSSTVKALAGKVVADHSAIEKEVTALAAARGIHLPPKGTAQGTGGLGRLAGLQGSAFDKGFLGWLSAQQSRNAAQAKQAQAGAQSAGDPVLAGLLGKLAPQLEQHAASARQARASLGSPRQARTGRSP